MSTPKYIREGRMGLPKTYKTGAVTNTYPVPMLVFNFDPGGLDICRRNVQPVSDPLQPVPEVACLDCYAQARQLDLTYLPQGAPGPFSAFVQAVNKLVQHKDKLPWKTIVLDPITGLTDIILAHMAAVDAKSLADARAWAYKIGMKIAQTISVLHTLPVHVVTIMHAALERNELTGEIFYVPMIPSSLRDRIGMLFSQFLFATIENGKPVVYTTARAYARGIGCRWPTHLPPVVEAGFDSIYGAQNRNNTTDTKP